MIDVYEELKKFASFDIDSITASEDNDFSIIIKNASKAYERLGKEQFKNSSKLEEISEILEENLEENNDKDELIIKLKDIIEDKDELIKNLKDIIENNKKKTARLLDGLTGISDAFENIYLFAVKSGNEALIESLNIQKDKNRKVLLLSNLIQIGEIGEIFDSRLHMAKSITFDESIQDGLVIDVLSKGYMFDGEILRKADVTINKKA